MAVLHVGPSILRASLHPFQFLESEDEVVLRPCSGSSRELAQDGEPYSNGVESTRTNLVLPASHPNFNIGKQRPIIGSALVYEGGISGLWKVVHMNDDGTYDIGHPSLGLRSGIELAVVEDGTRALERIQADNLEVVRQELPPWAFHEDVARYGSMSLSVGPSVPYLRSATIVTFATQVGVFGLAHFTAICKGTGSPSYPLWFRAAMLSLSVARGLVEWHALTYTLSDFVKFSSFRVLGCSVCFRLWLAFYGCCSQLNFLDIVSDSFFSARALQLLEHSNLLADLWSKVWERSLWSALPTPSLSSVVGVWWVMSLGQIVVPFFRTLRRSDMHCSTPHIAGDPGASASLCGKTMLRHDAVLLGLADANGFALLQSLAIPQTSSMLDNKNNILKIVDTLVYDMENLVDQMIERVFLTLLLENSLQLSLQSTFYVIGVAASKLQDDADNVQSWLLVSLGIGITTSWLKLLEVKGFLQVMVKAANRAEDVDDPRAAVSNNAVQRKKWIVVFGALVLVLSILNTSAMVVMAHVCKDALWNINGCVDLQE